MSHDTGINRFFLDAGRIAQEAKFIISSLPRVEESAVQRILLQLDAVRQILNSLDDPFTSEADKQHLLEHVDELIDTLQQHLKNITTQQENSVPRTATGERGQPAYLLDLPRALELHSLGNSWEDVAASMGVSRQTLYNHGKSARLSMARPAHTDIDDAVLDEIIAEISMKHPYVGSTIVSGHLRSRAMNIPKARVQESLRRVDAIGVLTRWAGIIKRRIYRVRGANALWHMDGNEKLRPWGFYIHGCIDGHSRLIIYLGCRLDKKAKTVDALYEEGVSRYGWPSRTRADFGKENNDVERRMISHWGEEHNAYLRGRSLHNIRIERLWKDVRKDTIEVYRRVFSHLEENGLLNQEDNVQCLCLYLVFQPRIQASLDSTIRAWNNHKIRTERSRTPIALFELSKEEAIRNGYWTGDPGDEIAEVDETYGVDEGQNLPPQDELDEDPMALELEDDSLIDSTETEALEDLEAARLLLVDVDLEEEDENWGIDVYCRAVQVLQLCLDNEEDTEEEELQ